jgi:hypothetical protein
MIDRQRLLFDLKPLLRDLEADLRVRCDEVVQINADLMKEYEQARAANRAGITFEEWRADLITQVAVAWVLSCTFVRFLEDNGLISPPRISGPQHGIDGQGLMRARDERDVFFRSHPTLTDRDYLQVVFDDLARLSGTKDVFGPHNPVSAYRNWLSGDAAQKIIEFFQKIDADGTGEIIHNFADDQWDTRFLGDLYQDLSEVARKKYALLQTPIFVEEFILDRTLEPAIKEFGLKDFRMIDPACGSGHFVLGSFARILNHWRKAEPGANDRELVNRALASVHGVDLNPYAVAIARFRLLLVAIRECGITQLKDAPSFRFNLACGDSLLHGSLGQQVFGFHELAHHYQSEDIDKLRRILEPSQYHAVVANPPYITVKDKALNQAYRERYPQVCHRQYSLAVPFMKRLFDLAYENGFTGQITANSFMKREFGKKLIENYLPKIDLTHVIDTSGVYIPGHGTPTVILFGRQRAPVMQTIRAVMSIKGEPRTPDNPSQGFVWTAIAQQVDRLGSQSAFVSVDDTLREQFGKHPWSIGGGGAADLREQFNQEMKETIRQISSSIGFCQDTHADEAFVQPLSFSRRHAISDGFKRQVRGDNVRDWTARSIEDILFPYDDRLEQWSEIPYEPRWSWLHALRTELWSRSTFGGGTYRSDKRPWFDYHQFPKDRLSTHLSIVFAFIATHNHFVLDRGGKVFNRSAPVIKLQATATEDDHIAILGLLNSSTACFWGRQTFFPKGGFAAGKWEERLEWDGTKLQAFPLPTDRPLALAKQLDTLSRAFSETLPSAVVAVSVPKHNTLAEARREADRLLEQMISLQEELDWQSYGLYKLIPSDQGNAPQCKNPPPIKLGQRAFEIVMARRIDDGEEGMAWFDRHGSTPIIEIPAEWPEEYKQVVQKRINLIKSDKNIALIELPECKRRWNIDPWEKQQEQALQNWLLDRLESYFDLDGRMNGQKTDTAKDNLREPRLTSVAKVADIAKQDKDFMQVAELYSGRMDFDVAKLVGELIDAESVPCLPILRYKPTSMDKRAAWERTWDLQRLEDAVDTIFDMERLKKIEPGKAEEVLHPLIAALQIDEQAKAEILRETVSATGYVAEATKQKLDPLNLVMEAAKRARQRAVGNIPVPPKYTSADFLSSNFWRLRGKLDVPKERWVSFPHCEGEDGTLVIAWAGYDHLQLVRAIAERYEHAKEQEGRKLVPLLACIGQLIPWLKQWHNEFDPAFGTRMGDYFANYLAEEAKALGMSADQVMAWTPPAKTNGRGKRKAK